MTAKQSEPIQWVVFWNGDMPRVSETFLLQTVAEMLYGQTPELACVLVVPSVPALIAKKIIQRGLAALRFSVLRCVPDDSQSVLNRNEQINLRVRREFTHGYNWNLRNACRINESYDQC